MDIQEIIITAVTSLLSSGIAASAISALMLKRAKKIEESARASSEKKIRAFLSTRDAKEKMLAELIGPICMHLRRTKQAFLRYKDTNKYLEAEVLYRGNLHARDLIISRGYFFDSDLMMHAMSLVEHYDAWLEEYSKQRLDPYSSGSNFVFAGPQGYPFPQEAEAAFMSACDRLRRDLYGQELNRKN